MSEEAKAVQEVAKASGKAIDAAQQAGGFLNRVFGNLLEDSIGLFADKLRFYRVEKFILLDQKTQKKLHDMGVVDTRPILPKIGIPLIEQATLEDDDGLHTKWANMLSNAMNPAYGGSIKRSYVSILADMEPVDVLILDILAKEYLGLDEQKRNEGLFDRAKIAEVVKISLEQCEISLRNLIRLGCLKPGVITNQGIQLGGHGATSYKDTELVGVTASGLEFYTAVN